MSRCDQGRSGHLSARLLRESIHTLNSPFYRVCLVTFYCDLSNSFKLSHSYNSDQSISVLRVVGWYFFIFIQILIVFIVFLKQTVETLIRRQVKVIIVINRKNETILILISLKTLFFAS